ncbi:MAG: lytic murein transglycosylase B [Proteobacteria bacterium]|nr:lytic murein transglycosylase B [Pseudomonadota bacterium]
MKMITLIRLPSFALAALFAVSLACAKETSPDYREHPAFDAFAARLVEHGYDRGELSEIFSGVQRQQKIIDLISRPAESKDWHEYEPIFLTDARIQAGAKFWNEHAETLARAEREFGVDQEIIVALIGVETFYGRITGSWRVIEALSTLGFDYPPRSSFFIKELEHFLLLAREEAIDPLSVSGSYAGAMGGGQFMPSSYREYAVDFDNDGKRDLWNSWADVIGSVAAYLSRHGWKHGEIVALPAALPGNRTSPLQQQGMRMFRAKALRDHGFVFSESVNNNEEVRLVALQEPDSMSYWIGLHNFGVINRYNRSALYAIAAIDLGSAIRKARQRN